MQADLKTFAAHDVYSTTVITCITAQNSLGINAIQAIDPSMVGAQLSAVLEDSPPITVKIGMLHNAETIYAVSEAISTSTVRHIVLDPVVISTSGQSLLEDSAIDVLINELIPLATLITPNSDELLFLAKRLNLSKAEAIENIGTRDDLELIGQALYAHLGSSANAPAILCKGGHLNNDTNASDLLIEKGQSNWLHSERINNPNTHGTGCTLASAITANLALGKDLLSATQSAKIYLSNCISAQLDLGKGAGPLWHGVSRN